MQFRQATDDEISRIMEIIEDGKAALAGLGLDQWQGGTPNVEMVSADVAAGYTMVVEQDGELLGTLAFVDTGEHDYDPENVTWGSWLSGDETTVDGPEGARCTYATLHRVAVANSATGKGVASFMMQRSIDMARERGLASVRADTHEGNIPMQRMLERNGFAHCCNVNIALVTEATKKRLGYEIVL